MRILHHLRHQLLRIEHPILLGYHPPRHREYRAKHREVEQDGAVGRDLEVQEEVRVEDGGEEEDGGEGARDECYEST